MKAFIAGATGYVGKAVVEQLAAKGHQVVAHVRPDSAKLVGWRNYFSGANAQVNTAQWTPEGLNSAMEQVAPEVVYLLLGTTRTRAKQDNQVTNRFEIVDFGLTTMLLNAACLLPTPPLIVYLSSLGASLDSRSKYLQVRARVEQEVIKQSASFVIVRASFISGSGRDDSRPGERLAAKASDGLLAVAGLLGAKKTQSKYRSVDNHQLAKLLIESAERTDRYNRILTLEQLS